MQLRREDGDVRDDRPRGPQRGRLIEANKVAQEFYADQLATPEALAGRQFLGERGFDQAAAEQFGVGFAPRDGEALLRHLRQKGFSDEERSRRGWSAQGRSAYDRFRGRLLWPIRDASGDTIGFGARRIFDDDRIEAKYLNTPETPLYKKSQVLYGIDLARRDIARTSQAVVVEGYTDVMACHLAGVPTAVATCGTSFGDDHARVLRRFLHDHEEFRGEVIFTFDGDAAGQKAALRAFDGDQNFVSQTYVAVEPDRPRPVRPADPAGRRGGPRAGRPPGAALPLRAQQRRRQVRPRPRRRPGRRAPRGRPAGDLDPRQVQGRRVLARARRAWSASTSSRPARRYAGPTSARRRDERRRRPRRGRARSGSRPGRPLPDPRDPRFAIERETLKLVLQHPGRSAGRPPTSAPTTSPTRPTARSGSWSRRTAARRRPTPAGPPGSAPTPPTPPCSRRSARSASSRC